MKTPKTLLLLSSLLLAAATARANLIVYDSFNYTLGTTSNDTDAGLNSGNGLPYTNAGGNPSGTGTGLRNNWATGTIVSGLTYSGLQTSGNAYQVTGSNNVGTGDNAWIYRNMTTDPNASLRVGGVSSGNLGADGTSLYFSMLFQVSSVPTNNNADRALLQLVGTNRFAIGLSPSSTNADKFSISNSAGGANFSSITATAGQTYFLVAQLNSVSGNDTLNLWVNPTIGSPLGAANATLSGVDLGGFAQFSPRFQGTGVTMTMDEVRIGTTFEAVSPIPEPGTLALVGIALGSLLFFRKRR